MVFLEQVVYVDPEFVKVFWENVCEWKGEGLDFLKGISRDLMMLQLSRYLNGTGVLDRLGFTYLDGRGLIFKEFLDLYII